MLFQVQSWGENLAIFFSKTCFQYLLLVDHIFEVLPHAWGDIHFACEVTGSNSSSVLGKLIKLANGLKILNNSFE